MILTTTGFVKAEYVTLKDGFVTFSLFCPPKSKKENLVPISIQCIYSTNMEWMRERLKSEDSKVFIALELSNETYKDKTSLKGRVLSLEFLERSAKKEEGSGEAKESSKSEPQKDDDLPF